MANLRLWYISTNKLRNWNVILIWLYDKIAMDFATVMSIAMDFATAMPIAVDFATAMHIAMQFFLH